MNASALDPLLGRQLSQLEPRARNENESDLAMVAATCAALRSVQGALAGFLGGAEKRQSADLAARVRDVLAGCRAAPGSEAWADALRDRFGELLATLDQLLERTRKGEVALRELESAGALQRAWMKPSETLSRGSLAISRYCSYVNGCGGDWLAAYDLDEDHILLLLADVTGHGADSALVVGVAKGACELLVHQSDGAALGPAGLLQGINTAICGSGGATFMTCSVAKINTKTGLMHLANAAHPFPLLSRGSPSRTISEMAGRGPLLGFSADASFEETEFVLDPGDVVVWYTDGVVDRPDPRGRAFGKRRLASLLQGAASLAPEDLSRELCAELDRFGQTTAAGDDLSYIITRFAG